MRLVERDVGIALIIAISEVMFLDLGGCFTIAATVVGRDQCTALNMVTPKQPVIVTANE